MVARIKDPTARELMELALELDRLSKLQRPQVADPLRIEHNLDCFRMGSVISVSPDLPQVERLTHRADDDLVLRAVETFPRGLIRVDASERPAKAIP
jgi:hypothetical protein